MKYFKEQNFSLLFDDESYQHPLVQDVLDLFEFNNWTREKVSKIVGVKFSKRHGSSTIVNWINKDKDMVSPIKYSAWRLLLINSDIVVK